MEGSTHAVEVLLRHGADINAVRTHVTIEVE